MAKPAWVTLLQTELLIDDGDVPEDPSAGWTNIKIDFLTHLLNEYMDNMELNDDPKVLVFVNNVIEFIADGSDDDDTKSRLLVLAIGFASKSYRVGQMNARLAANVCKYALRDYDSSVASAARAASQLYDTPASAITAYSDVFMDLVI